MPPLRRRGTIREIDFYPLRVLGRVVDLPIRMPNPSPTLDKNLASMGPGISSSIGVGVWRKAPEAFAGSNTTLDTFQSATIFVVFGPCKSPSPSRQPLFRTSGSIFRLLFCNLRPLRLRHFVQERAADPSGQSER